MTDNSEGSVRENPIFMFRGQNKQNRVYFSVFAQPASKRILTASVGGKSLAERFQATYLASLHSQQWDAEGVQSLEEVVFFNGEPWQVSRRQNFLSPFTEVDSDRRFEGSGRNQVLDAAAQEYGLLFALDNKLGVYLPTHFTALHERLRKEHV